MDQISKINLAGEQTHFAYGDFNYKTFTLIDNSVKAATNTLSRTSGDFSSGGGGGRGGF